MKLFYLFISCVLLFGCGIKKELLQAERINSEQNVVIDSLKIKNKELELTNQLAVDLLKEELRNLKIENKKLEREVFDLMFPNENIVIDKTATPGFPSKGKFYVLDVSPEFPGGYEKKMEFLGKNVNYPQMALKSGVKGKVYIEVIIEKDGSLTNINAVKGIGSGCDQEALRVMRLMPNWTPGKIKGIPVRTKITIPFNFVLR